MPILMTVGVGLFFAGVAGVMALLFSNGGAQKSRQFEVFGQLWSGKLGPQPRRFLRLAMVLVGSGALLCFAGVGRMDAERAQRCSDYCIAAGYAEGKIGPSVERSKAGRFVACVCTAPGKEALELRADTVGRAEARAPQSTR